MDGVEISVAIGSAIGGAFGGLSGVAVLVRSQFKSLGVEIGFVRKEVKELKDAVKEQNATVHKHGLAIVEVKTRCEINHPEGS
jgi:hypothetical protein